MSGGKGALTLLGLVVCFCPREQAGMALESRRTGGERLRRGGGMGVIIRDGKQGDENPLLSSGKASLL